MLPLRVQVDPGDETAGQGMDCASFCIASRQRPECIDSGIGHFLNVSRLFRNNDNFGSWEGSVVKTACLDSYLRLKKRWIKPCIEQIAVGWKLIWRWKGYEMKGNRKPKDYVRPCPLMRLFSTMAWPRRNTGHGFMFLVILRSLVLYCWTGCSEQGWQPYFSPLLSPLCSRRCSLFVFASKLSRFPSTSFNLSLMPTKLVRPAC